MARGYNPDREAARIRDRISEIKGQLERERDYFEYGATYDHEYRMSEVRMEALRLEKSKLQEILGDL